MFAEIRRFRAELSAGPLTGVNWFQTAVGACLVPKYLGEAPASTGARRLPRAQVPRRGSSLNWREAPASCPSTSERLQPQLARGACLVPKYLREAPASTGARRLPRAQVPQRGSSLNWREAPASCPSTSERLRLSTFHWLTFSSLQVKQPESQTLL